MDSLDRELIKNLQADARLSLRELGRRLNVPHTTIFTRVNKLVDKGIIKKFSAVLHPQDLGFKINLLLIEAPLSDSSDIADSIASCEEVMKVYRTSDGKIIAKAISDDASPDCLDNLMGKIAGLKTTVLSVEEVHKFDHSLHDDFVNLLE